MREVFTRSAYNQQKAYKFIGREPFNGMYMYMDKIKIGNEYIVKNYDACGHIGKCILLQFSNDKTTSWVTFKDGNNYAIETKYLLPIRTLPVIQALVSTPAEQTIRPVTATRGDFFYQNFLSTISDQSDDSINEVLL